MSTSELRTLTLDSELLLPLLDRMIWPILLLVSGGIFLTVPNTFRNIQSIELILHGSVGLGFLVLAESVCLISGHFDLSVGSIAGFSAMVAGLALSPEKWGLLSDPIAGVILIVLIGTLVGILNGVFVGKVGIDPFLQTLAFLIIFEGAKLVLSTVTVTGLPDGYIRPGNDPLIAISLLFLAFTVIGSLMKYTSYGQAVYAIGSEKPAARAVGISTEGMIISVYGISGFLSAVGGLMLTGFAGVVSPEIGSGLVFPAFAAAVIGGVSLFGGRGKISGALGGVILLGVIQAALSISGTPPEGIRFVNGIVLFVAILLYSTRTRLRERIIAAEA